MATAAAAIAIGAVIGEALYLKIPGALEYTWTFVILWPVAAAEFSFPAFLERKKKDDD